MKQLTTQLTLFICLIFAMANYTMAEPKVSNISPLTNTIITNLYQGISAPPDVENKVVILNFWATWCTICRHEMPDQLNIAKIYPNDVAIVMVSEDKENPFQVKTYIEKFKQSNKQIKASAEARNTHWYYDNNERLISKFTNSPQVPYSIIFDKSGKIVKEITGLHNWSSNEIFKLIDTLL